jgi:hypothetical protein
MLDSGTTTINSIRVRNGDDPFEDELFNMPYAEMVFSDQLMSGGEEGSDEYEEEDSEMLAENAISINDIEDEE